MSIEELFQHSVMCLNSQENFDIDCSCDYKEKVATVERMINEAKTSKTVEVTVEDTEKTIDNIMRKHFPANGQILWFNNVPFGIAMKNAAKEIAETIDNKNANAYTKSMNKDNRPHSAKVASDHWDDLEYVDNSSALQTFIGEVTNDTGRKFWAARIAQYGKQVYGDAFKTKSEAKVALDKAIKEFN